MPSFSPVTSFPVDTTPQMVRTADFNNDGQLDLATVNYSGGTVSVLLGDGQGGFGAANHFATDTKPQSMAVGDFNNDGNLDLVTANAGGYTINNEWSSISRLMGEGDGTFRPRDDTVIFGQALLVAAADFNADGNMDFALTSRLLYESVEVSVALGDGSGGFVDSGGMVWLATEPAELAVADLNADGYPDLVTANNNGNVSVLMGNGDGSLNYSDSGSSEFATSLPPRAVAVGDFTGDGIPDLVTTGQTVVDVLPGLGDGTFAAPIPHSTNGTWRTAVAAADFDGDGKLDVVTSDADTGAVNVMLGNADGTLTYAGAFSVGSSPADAAVGDFNGDGRMDMATANAGSNTVSILFNDGVWSPVPPPPPSIRIHDVSVTEGNRDTVEAVFTVTLSAASTETITVAYSTGDGTATTGSDYNSTSDVLTFAPGETSKTISVAVNGDTSFEPDETFLVNLSNANGATIADGEAVGTIVDDDVPPLPEVRIDDVSKNEGRHGTTRFTFTVTLSAAYNMPVTLNFATSDGTAKTSDNDYVADSGAITFAPGQTTKTITVVVKGDKKKEANENFFVDLSDLSSYAVFLDSRGMGTIQNDD